jgi:hypothetical protein
VAEIARREENDRATQNRTTAKRGRDVRLMPGRAFVQENTTAEDEGGSKPLLVFGDGRASSERVALTR